MSDYRREVKRRLRNRVDSMYGNKSTRWIIVGTWFIVNIIAFFVIRKYWGEDTALHDVIVSSVVSSIVTVMAFGGILFGWRYGEIPEEIYVDLQTEIAQYRKKWGLDKVDADRILLLPEKSIDHRAILKIENREGVDLEDCYGHPIKVMVGDEKHWENVTHSANSGTELLTWFIHSDATRWTVNRDTSELLCVAFRHNDGNIGITHHARVNTINKNDPDASIYVEIQIDGSLNQKPIFPLCFKGFIRRNGDDIYLDPGELYEKFRLQDPATYRLAPVSRAGKEKDPPS